MWPYTDDESAWLGNANHRQATPNREWPTPQMIEYYVRRGEQLRAEVIARASAQCWRFLGRAIRRAWHMRAERPAGRSHRRSAT